MSTHFDPRFRQARRTTDGARRTDREVEYEVLPPHKPAGKHPWLERLIQLFARTSEEVLTGAVVGLVAATPVLRQLFLRILLGAALAGALLALLLTFLLISLFT